MDTLEGIRRVQRHVDWLMRKHFLPEDCREDLYQDAAVDVLKYGCKMPRLQARRVVVDMLRAKFGRYGEKSAIFNAIDIWDPAFIQPWQPDNLSPEARCIASRLVPRMGDRERQIFRLRADDWPLEKIAHEIGVSEGRVCQIIKRTQRRLEGHACNA